MLKWLIRNMLVYRQQLCLAVSFPSASKIGEYSVIHPNSS